MVCGVWFQVEDRSMSSVEKPDRDHAANGRGGGGGWGWGGVGVTIVEGPVSTFSRPPDNVAG